MMNTKSFLLGLACLPLVTVTTAQAVINAGLQPYDLYQSRYRQALALTVDQADTAQGRVRAHITHVYKGTAKQDSPVTLQFTGDVRGAVTNDAFAPGKPIAVFAGRRRQAQDLMLFAEGFYLGRMQPDGTWVLDRSSEKIVGVDGQSIPTLAGTWNGSTDQLLHLLADIAADDDHFPRKAYARFKSDILLDKLDQPVSALGLYDIEGDGDEDLVVCSPGGDRLYLQTDPMSFVLATESFGLTGASPSCCLGDVDGDSLTDLLAGSVLYRGAFADNRFQFVKTDLLPDIADLKTATLVELNGDGYPDVLASVTGRGLRAFVNQQGQGFQEATQAMGLDRPDCGTNGTGFVTTGDWNGDRRSDLFYAVGSGLLLVQDERGQFRPQAHDIAFKFTVGISDTPGLTGAGVFLPLLSPERMDLLVPLEDGWLTIANRQGRPVDITPWGNEISEGSNDQRASVAADLNLDGHIDFYTISAAANGHNRFIVNRGYGSFMLASVHKHYEHMFDGPAHERGGLAVAAGDLDEDGAPDLVIGNRHGDVTLILNDTLAVRRPIDHPPREIKILEETRLLKVRVLGSRGVVNARIQVKDANAKLVARRDLTRNTSGGSCGPHHVCLALRRPGVYQLEVTYADGLVRSQSVDLRAQPHLTVNVDRGEEDPSDVW
jgi:hypothetical protein